MQGIGHTIPPYPGQNRQVGAGGGCRSCCSIFPHPHSHSLDIASGSAPSLAGGTGFSVPGIFRSRDRSRPRGSVIEGVVVRLYISFPIARAGPERFSPCWWRAIGDAPERYGGRACSGNGEGRLLRSCAVAGSTNGSWGKGSSLVPAKIMKKSLFSSFSPQPGAAPQSTGRRRQRPERAVRSVWAS